MYNVKMAAASFATSSNFINGCLVGLKRSFCITDASTLGGSNPQV